MKQKPKPKPVVRARKAPHAGVVVTPSPATSAVPSAPQVPAKGNKKAAQRLPAPKTFSFELEQVLVVEWYDEGARFAVGKLQAQRYTWSEDQERWIENIDLQLLNAVGCGAAMEVNRKHVTLFGQVVIEHEEVRHKWKGPRETLYDLREPNDKERITANGYLKCAAVAKVQARGEAFIPGTGTLTKVRAGGVAARIQELIQRKGGATMKELEQISITSQRSSLAMLKKRGLNITITRRSDGVKVYEVKPPEVQKAST
jgi:hypothetical protein